MNAITISGFICEDGVISMAEYVFEFSKKRNLYLYISQENSISIQNVIGTIVEEDERFVLNFQGEEENVISVIRSVWELAALYDGYFYKPGKYCVDGIEKNVDDLFFLSFYKTGNIWTNFARPLIGSNRDYSAEMINRYINYSSKGRETGKWNKRLVKAFFYLHSKSYDEINAEHRLSLLLNLCDGFAINIFGDDNVSENMGKILETTMASEKVKYGASLLGIPEEKVYQALAKERHEIDHYIIKEGSLSEYIVKANPPISHYYDFYFTYVVELAIRIALLKEIGCGCDAELIDDVLDEVNDWLIYECDLNVECCKEENRCRQKLRKKGIYIR